jgi:hypothetical protein
MLRLPMIPQLTYIDNLELAERIAKLDGSIVECGVWRGGPAEPIALLRLDDDWYESTKCVLEHLAPRVKPGGIVIVDDYYCWEGCTRAVNEYAFNNNWMIRQTCHGGVLHRTIDGCNVRARESSESSRSLTRREASPKGAD